MSSFKYNLKMLTYITRILLNRDKRFVLSLIFANYMHLRLIRLLKMQLKLKSIPDGTLQLMISSKSPLKNSYIDTYSCVLANANLVKHSTISWYYICCTSSLKKYEVLIYPMNNVCSNELVMSETMKFNLQNHLNSENSDSTRYFMIAASDLEQGIAEEAEISLITNPYDCPEDFLDNLLHNYFSEARYLRANDVLSIDIKKFAPSYRYLLSRNKFKEVLFKVRHINVDKRVQNPKKGSFVLRGLTALVQKPNIHSYLPCKHLISIHKDKINLSNNTKIMDAFMNNYPPSLEESLKLLTSCISPFIQYDTFVDVRPLFLVKGPRGSGKSSLVRITAERMGLNLLNVDFSEIQSLTSSQTEAKLRIVLNNAKNCIPCILLLSNIQIFGKDGEGKEDERIISSFDLELKNLYKIGTKYPLVVVATGDNSLIPTSLQQIFIETIHMEQLNPIQRFESLKWLLATKGFENEAELSHVAALCTDFVLADLNAIVLHAAKIRARLSPPETQTSGLMLTRDDFNKAHEYMQSRYSDWIGAPRVPKVYWEDIGGLADLKNEILRRIELPLMTSDNIGLTRTGLLLYGPPGTGKTLLAKAVATECQVHFLSVKGPELLNMYVGQSEKNVRQVFERARSSAPCVIFFDELDSLAPNRGKNGDSGGVMDRVVSQLLAEIDGIESSGSVFIIGATNRPDLIDPALLRPGRFDKLLYVGISSDKKSQLSILQALTRKFEFPENRTKLEELVEKLPDNLTGADMYAICSNAWLLAVRRNLEECNKGDTEDVQPIKAGNLISKNIINNKVVVTKEDFLKAAQNIVPSVSKDELKRYEELRSELSPIIR